MKKLPAAIALASAIAFALTAEPARASSATRCAAGKDKTAGSYFACRMKAEAAALLRDEPADYGRCVAKFEDRWDSAEERGGGACPDDASAADIGAWLAAQADVAADVVAGGSPVPACGNGIIDVPGEHCDGADLGGATCAALSYVGGTLACDSTCRFDTTGCDCPPGSRRANGICWVVAPFTETTELVSCDDACAAVGLGCNEGATQAIGSAGSDETCRAMSDIADPDASPHSGSVPNDVTACGPAVEAATGCLVYPEIVGNDVAVRFVHDDGPTTCGATLACVPFPAVFRRVCGCTP